MDGKRAQDCSKTGDETILNKRLKSSEKSKTTAFREWSKSAQDGTSKTLTIKCIFGDPSAPLPSWIKTSKLPELKGMLSERGLSKDGKKPVLLERLQKDLPSVTISIDSRECIQRLLNSILFHLDWDNTHLFELKLPARGELKEGTNNLWMEAFGLDFGLSVKMGNVNSNLNSHDKRMRNHIQRKLDAAGMQWSDIERAKNEPDALGKWRTLTGSGFSHESSGATSDWCDDERAEGGHFTLEELCVEKNDKMKLLYDFGDDNKFTLEVLDVKMDQPVIEEVKLYGLDTRAKLVEKSRAKIRSQYQR